jgi:GNAT superfamily N-acetyltransferase
MYKIEDLSDQAIPGFREYYVESIMTDFPFFSDEARAFYVSDEYADRMMNNHFRFVAKDGEKIVGFLLATEPFGGIVFINWVQVDPGYRKHNIGTHLLDAVAKAAKEQGAHALHLVTRDPLVPFYKQAGFKLLAVDYNGYFNGDDHLMRRHL